MYQVHCASICTSFIHLEFSATSSSQNVTGPAVKTCQQINCGRTRGFRGRHISQRIRFDLLYKQYYTTKSMYKYLLYVYFCNQKFSDRYYLKGADSILMQKVKNQTSVGKKVTLHTTNGPCPLLSLPRHLLWISTVMCCCPCPSKVEALFEYVSIYVSSCTD